MLLQDPLKYVFMARNLMKKGIKENYITAFNTLKSGLVANVKKLYKIAFKKFNLTLKRQYYRYLPTNCLSVFDDFVGLVLKGLRLIIFDVYRT